MAKQEFYLVVVCKIFSPLSTSIYIKCATEVIANCYYYELYTHYWNFHMNKGFLSIFFEKIHIEHSSKIAIPNWYQNMYIEFSIWMDPPHLLVLILYTHSAGLSTTYYYYWNENLSIGWNRNFFPEMAILVAISILNDTYSAIWLKISISWKRKPILDDKEKIGPFCMLLAVFLFVLHVYL